MSLSTAHLYPSDAISVRCGRQHVESRDVTEWLNRYAKDYPSRVVFAINQHYSELKSGHYLNKALIAVVQESMISCGLYVVIEDNYRGEGIVPVELNGSLEIGDDYLLVDNALMIRGRLRVWEAIGGKSAFYHDNLVLDILTNVNMVKAICADVCERCVIRHVACECPRDPRGQ